MFNFEMETNYVSNLMSDAPETNTTSWPFALPEPVASITSTAVTPCWPFALPEPYAPHPNELQFLSSMQFSLPPLSSSLYCLPITPERPLPVSPISTRLISPTPTSSYPTLPELNTSRTPRSGRVVPLPLPTTPTTSPNSLRDIVVDSPSSPVPSQSIFSSPIVNTSSLPYPFPTLDHSTLPTTHATRNPHLATQESRVHPKISTAQKATKALQAKATKEKRALLSTAIQTLQEKHEKEFEALARTHHVTTEYVSKLLATPHFKKTRGVSLQNAKVHAKAVEVNADLGVGQRIKLKEIKQLVKNDPLLQDLSIEQEEILREGVREMRGEKKLGARLTNQAVAQDFRLGFTAVTDMINSISSRTGACVLTIWSRGNLDDIYEPCWMVTDNASTFVPDVLGKSMWDVTRLLEQWACSKAGARNPDTLASMRTECSATINGALRMVTQSKVVDMNYDNYEEKIVQRLKVKLVGWPFENVISPAKLYTIGELRTLRDALRCGACCWVKLSKSELKVHADNMATRRKAGEVIGKTRKERSDKGVKTGPRRKAGACGDSDESGDDGQSDGDGGSTSRTPAEGPSKKRKAAPSADKLARPSKKRKEARKDLEAGPSKKRKAPGKKSAKSQLPPSKETISTDTDETDDQ